MRSTKRATPGAALRLSLHRRPESRNFASACSCSAARSAAGGQQQAVGGIEQCAGFQQAGLRQTLGFYDGAGGEGETACGAVWFAQDTALQGELL